MAVEFATTTRSNAATKAIAARCYLSKIPRAERRGLSVSFADDTAVVPIIRRADGSVYFDGRPAAATAKVERVRAPFAEQRKAAALARIAALKAEARAKHDAARTKIAELKAAAVAAIDNYRPSWR